MVHTPEQAEAFISQLGPDPLVGPSGPARKRFIDAMTRTTTPIGVALMNQKIVGGIGNVYRAELLFRHRLNPFTPSSQLPAELLAELWRDWALLLRRGVKTGVMVTRDDLSAGQRQRALGDSALRHFVYHRAGLACYRCGEKVAVSIVATRKLYFCPGCQDQPSR
jgi:formamidopyrimidine-DNA glycosylase